MSDNTTGLLTEVLQERVRQNQKWGEQNHTPLEWLAVLVEEVGEASTEILRFRFGESAKRRAYLEQLRAELIQVAAVAVAACESLDRNEIGEEKVRAALAREAVWRGQLGLVMEAMVEAATIGDHACIAVMREQLALRDARIAALEEAIRHVLDDARPSPTPGSAVVGYHAIRGLKNAMYVGSGPCERGGDAT